MTISETSFCPNCGGKLKYYDKVSRIVLTKGGAKNTVSVKRYRCVDCNKIHRFLPNFIFPYKHYDAEIIKGVLEGLITPDTLGYEDYPCEVTMIRWSRK